MRNYLQLCLVIFYIKILHAAEIQKRIFPLYIKKGVRLDDPYQSVQIGRYNLVLCGLLCKNEAQCIASSFSRADFTCRLHTNIKSSEVVDSDATLVYQNEGKYFTYMDIGFGYVNQNCMTIQGLHNIHQISMKIVRRKTKIDTINNVQSNYIRKIISYFQNDFLDLSSSEPVITEYLKFKDI